MTMTRTIAAAAALAVLALAGCGGSSTEGAAPDRRRGRQHPPRRLLDAARGVREADRPLPRRRGRGRLLPAVLRRLRRAEPRGRGGAPRRRRRILARARHDAPGRVRRRREGLERRRAQGHGHRLRRRLHGPRGQPEGDQDLGRPDEGRRRGPDPEPVHIRRRPLERHGRLRRPARAGQDARAGARVPEQAVRERGRPGQERTRVADDVRRPARATSSSATRTRRSSPSARGSRSSTSSPTRRS